MRVLLPHKTPQIHPLLPVLHLSYHAGLSLLLHNFGTPCCCRLMLPKMPGGCHLLSQ